MKRRMVTPGYTQARLGSWVERESHNIPDKTQFRNSSRDSLEVHCFAGEVWVMAALGGRFALPLAALIFAAFGDLPTVLLISTRDVQLAFDICLQE
jgi:hypothetical protein